MNATIDVKWPLSAGSPEGSAEHSGSYLDTIAAKLILVGPNG